MLNNLQKYGNKIIFIVGGCLLLAAVFFGGYVELTNHSMNTAVVWEERERIPSSSTVYMLSDSDEEQEIFISTLVPLKKDEVVLESGWSLRELDQDLFWDPTACAKMPSVRVMDTLFFKEVIVDKNTHTLRHSILRYDIEKNDLLFLDVTDEETIGDIYRDGEYLYYFTYKDKTLFVNKLQAPNFDLNQRERVALPLPELITDDLVFFYDDMYRVFFSLFDSGMQSRTYVYHPEIVSFVETDVVNRLRTTEIIGLQKFVRLKNPDFIVEYGITDVYKVRILDREKDPIALFDSQENIVKYVIDAF